MVWLIVLALLLPAGNVKAAAFNSCVNCHGQCRAADTAGHECSWCHFGSAATSRRDLAHRNLVPPSCADFRSESSQSVHSGAHLAELLACRRCHVVGGSGNRLAQNLDGAVRTLGVAQMRQALRQPAQQMPRFNLPAHDVDSLVSYLLHGAYASVAGSEQPPLVVHFTADNAVAQLPFERHCGGCHQVLSAQYGGLGTGRNGPNLSGLFSRFYPANAERHWNAELLQRWLRNPRQLRPVAIMPPLQLNDDEFAGLLQTFRVADDCHTPPAR